MVGVAITVVGFMCSFEGGADFCEDGFLALLQRIEVFLFKLFSKILQGFLTTFQVDFVALCQRTNISQFQVLIEKVAESRLSEPIINRYWQVQIRMILDPLLKQILERDQFIVIQLAQFRMFLLLPLPNSQNVTAPLPWIAYFQLLFVGFEWNMTFSQTNFKFLHFHRLPKLKQRRVISVIVAVM